MSPATFVRSGRAAGAEWRAFAAPRYRAFHHLGFAQGLVGALVASDVVITLLLLLGCPPALAGVIGVLPLTASVGQLAVPTLLRRTDGDLRRLTLVAIGLGESRGLLLAFVTALAALGLVGHGPAIVLIALISLVAGVFASVSGSNMLAWYHALLPEAERRRVSPKMISLAMALGAISLLPIGLALDHVGHDIALWAYVGLFLVGGFVGLFELRSARRLPRPGRVRVPATAELSAVEPPALRRFLGAMAISSLGAGVSPYTSIFLIAVLGGSAGTAIVLAAVSAGASLIGVMLAGSIIARTSSSRMLRASMRLRAGSMLLFVGAFPGNPLAMVFLTIAVIGAAFGFAVAQIAQNERIFRLSDGPAAVAHQSRFVAISALGITAGQVAGSIALAIGASIGYPVFAGLFGASALLRYVASRRIEVSATWASASVAALPIERRSADRAGIHGSEVAARS
jgi:hypothetical protein